MSTRVVSCSTCGRAILDNSLENAVHDEFPYPFDDGIGMCQSCASFRRVERQKLSYDERINRIRAILSSKTAKKMEGVLVDTFTASAIISVYDALSPQKQIEFSSMSVRKMSAVAWKAVMKSKEGRQ